MKLLKPILVLVIIAGTIFFLQNCTTKKEDKTVLNIVKTDVKTKEKTITSGYAVGDIATDFKLKNIDDKMVSLSQYKDAKGFIIIFTCNHCPYSVAYEDRIIALDKKYKTQGYPVIAINPNDPEISKGDDFKAMKVRAKEKGFTFPYLFDEGQKIFPQYGATRTPHVYILNREKGALKVAYIGAIDNNAFEGEKADVFYTANAVDALLKGEKPKENFTKAIGCSIKVKK